MAGPGNRVIVVTGDVTMDWNLAHQPLEGDGRDTSDTRASWQRGGAALLVDLVDSISATLPSDVGSLSVLGVDAPQEPIAPGDDTLNHSYAIWAPFERVRGVKGESSWRVASFLGVDAALTDDGVLAEWARLAREVGEADVIAVDDGALGFRDHSEQELWRRTMAGDRRPWVLLKAARPVTGGRLWEHLLAECAGDLVVVMTIDDLRGTEVQVSRGLSWERTAQDLFWELVHKPQVNALSQVAHTIVSFGGAGAALISGRDGGGASSCSLYYDPEVVEGVWESRHPGRMMGSTDCLVAALIRELLIAPEEPRLDRGIQAGVAAARLLHLEGYEERGPGRMELGFPISRAVEEMAADRAPLQEIEVSDPAGSAVAYWTILRDRAAGDLADTAVRTAVSGPEHALPGVPLGRFGKLETADRSEIEAFRSIGALIAGYSRDSESKPISIGVFGPPGSGKSFGIVQVARSVAPGLVSEPLEFNLSQFRSPDELADALHLVRDVGLAGEVPLVFWDEFDTPLDGRPLGWLRYFLAPMQDGEFREGQLTHPVGRSIFVFAGGTCERVQEFGVGMDPERFREAKGPDFVSRLKGYVNVLGPNPPEEGEDPYFVIRRAILLRSILRRRAPKLFSGNTLHIDPGVLRAFLETKTYKHGARSLEAIVAMSFLVEKTSFERSSLPAEPQLDLHVTSSDFLSLVQRMDLQGDLLEKLAEAAHDTFCEGLRARGYEFGAAPDEEKKISDALVPYQDLPEPMQEQNRGNVRDIPAKLERVGCVMVPARAGLLDFTFTSGEVELLARDEHERWMKALGDGWRHGKPTDKANKVHEAYLPWDDLPESQTSKDKDFVREIPRILARAGYAVIRSTPTSYGS